MPVRFTYDNNYFNDRYQGVPEGGYNVLIRCLLEGVECRLNCNYLEHKPCFDSLAEMIVYTGPIDEFFDYTLGRLEYRSLRFEQETVPTTNYQGSAIVNYTYAYVPYTRIVEHKFFDINNSKALSCPYSVITREYPTEYNEASEPYYPVNDAANVELYNKYKQIATVQCPDVIFSGRLGSYKYLDMDKTIRMAMDIAKEQLWTN